MHSDYPILVHAAISQMVMKWMIWFDKHLTKIIFDILNVFFVHFY